MRGTLINHRNLTNLSLTLGCQEVQMIFIFFNEKFTKRTFFFLKISNTTEIFTYVYRTLLIKMRKSILTEELKYPTFHNTIILKVLARKPENLFFWTTLRLSIFFTIETLIKKIQYHFNRQICRCLKFV